MGKKLETKHSPEGFYESDTIPVVEEKSYYFALDNDASLADVFKVQVLISLNKKIDLLKGNSKDDKQLSEELGIDQSDLSRIRKYRYKYFSTDKIMKFYETINKESSKRMTSFNMMKQLIKEVESESKGKIAG